MKHTVVVQYRGATIMLKKMLHFGLWIGPLKTRPLIQLLHNIHTLVYIFCNFQIIKLFDDFSVRVGFENVLFRATDIY